MKSALLIIDIQNDYFEGGAMALVNADMASENAKRVLECFRGSGLPVVHVQHIVTRPTAVFFLPNTRGSEIHGSVTPLCNEKVVVKHFPNSFRETELLDHLKNNGVTDLVMCGMMTHMCVDATARAAKDLGFGITLIGDACATRDLEINGQKVKAVDVHNGFLAALNSTYADVLNTRQYLEQLGHKKESRI